MEDKGLQAIKERLAAVSKEQWVAQLGDPMNWEPSSVRLESGEMVANRLNAEQAEFIANAHQDVPALIAEVERLREALEFYADDEKWEPTIDLPFEPDDYCSEIDLDKGRIARKALEGESK